MFLNKQQKTTYLTCCSENDLEDQEDIYDVVYQEDEDKIYDDLCYRPSSKRLSTAVCEPNIVLIVTSSWHI